MQVKIIRTETKFKVYTYKSDMTIGTLIGESKITIPMISKRFNIINPNSGNDTVMVKFDTNRTKIMNQSTLKSN